MKNTEPRLALIAAVSSNGVIGRNGTIPWHIPADLGRFRDLTEGQPIVMGARTFESLPGLLPNRPHIVVTSRFGSLPDGVLRARSPDEAFDLARNLAGRRIWIIGGRALYSHFLPMTDEIQLTRIDADIDGDIFFPDFDIGSFHESETGSGECRQPDGRLLAYRFLGYDRRRASPAPLAP